MSLRNSDLAELFASRDRIVIPVIEGGKIDYQPWTRRSGNQTMYFNGNRIYSYGDHFCIAELDPARSLARVTLRKYSVTTSRHVSETLHALLKNGWCIERVPSLDGVTGRGL